MRVIIEDLSGKRYQVFASCLFDNELIIVDLIPNAYRTSGHHETGKIQKLLLQKRIRHEIIREN